MNFLFVYGTLQQSANPFGLHLAEHSTKITLGKFRGRLFDIGPYPGAIYDDMANTYVQGSVLSLHHLAGTLNLLDEYEGFGSTEAQPNEFVRELIDVECSSGTLQCWAYLYNLPVCDFTHIESGDYLQYISKKIP